MKTGIVTHAVLMLQQMFHSEWTGCGAIIY
jgi:hypothetical protein